MKEGRKERREEGSKKMTIPVAILPVCVGNLRKEGRKEGRMEGRMKGRK